MEMQIMVHRPIMIKKSMIFMLLLCIFASAANATMNHSIPVSQDSMNPIKAKNNSDARSLEDMTKEEVIKEYDKTTSFLAKKVHDYQSEEYQDYRKFVIENNKIYLDSFRTQQTATIIFLWMVVGIVVCGSFFSALHLAAGLGLIGSLKTSPNTVTPTNTTQGVQNTADQPATQNILELEISLAQVKLKSSQIGLAVLCLSLGFFFLYLTFVYPVQFANNQPPVRVSQTENPSKK
jgi:hypothetical protein